MLKKLSITQLLTPNLKWFEQQQTSILSAAIIITGANVISALAALVRQRILTNIFFDTTQLQQHLEAFLIAFQVPDMMFQLLVIGSVSAAFIPIFTAVKKSHDEQTAFKLTNSILTTLLLCFAALSIVIAIFSYQITDWRTGAAYSQEQIALTAHLTRWLLIAQLFFVVSSVHAAFLQSYQRFVIPALAPILYNVGIILGAIFFSPTLGIEGPALGVCIGAFMHMAIQLPFSRKMGYRYRPSLNFNVPGFKKIITLMPARTLTLAVSELQTLILTFFTTNLGNLSYLIVRYAMIIITLPIRFFGVPIGQASLPFLSEQSNPSERAVFKELLTKSLNQVAFFAMPASILIIILRLPIVRIVYGTPNFPWEQATLPLAQIVGIIAISITVQSMVQIVIRAFFALKDTWTPLLVAGFDLTMYVIGLIIVNTFLTQAGVVGVAWIVCVAAFFELFWLLWLLHRRIGQLLTTSLLINQLKILVASFLMAVFLYLPYRIFDDYVFNTSRALELVLLTITTGTIGTVVYIYFAHLFRIPELALVQKLLGGVIKTKPLVPTTEMVAQQSENETL